MPSTGRCVVHACGPEDADLFVDGRGKPRYPAYLQDQEGLDLIAPVSAGF